MRRFLYFFPGLGGMNPGMLRDRGLLSRFTNHGGTLIEHGVTPVIDGPGAGGGCIVAAGPQPATYESGRQRWTQGEKCWVGVEDVELPPRPEDLERDIGIKGYVVTLGDSLAWRVPLIRRWNTQTLRHVSALPQSIRSVKVDGKNMGAAGVAPQYEYLDAMADRIFVDFINQRLRTLDGAFADAVELLEVNYRIGLEEASLLGLLDGALAVKILGLCIDVPGIMAHSVEWATEGLQPAEPKIEEEL